MNISDEYFAGLFDGEGYFKIARAAGTLHGSKREWSFQCSAALTIREEFLILGLEERFGGTAKLQKSMSDKHSPYYKWQVSGIKALKFAEDMEHLLIAKRDHAKIIIAFQREKIANGNRPLSDWRYEFYEECFLKMKALNQKGIGKVICQ